MKFNIKTDTQIWKECNQKLFTGCVLPDNKWILLDEVLDYLQDLNHDNSEIVYNYFLLKVQEKK